MTSLRDEARRLAEQAASPFVTPGHTWPALNEGIESAILAFAKLVLEHIQKASGFDEETSKLAEQGWERGFCSGQRVTNHHIVDALRELEEGK